MKRIIPILSLCIPLLTTIVMSQPAIERRVDSLLSLMTLDEKVGQLVQYSDNTSGHRALIRAGKIGSFLNVLGTKETRELQKIAVEESRLKIPLIF